MFDPSRLEPEGNVRQPILRVPPATLTLALLLIAAFVAMRLLLTPEEENVLFARYGFQPAAFLAWLHGEGQPGPALWPLPTHLVLHYDALHLITNVGFLLAFASPVERRVGWAWLLVLFLLCGFAGAMAQVWLTFDAAERETVLIGASGGIFGLVGAALLLGPPRLGRVSLVRVAVILMVLNVAIGLASEAGYFGGYLIGWQAHAGGFVMGLLLAWPLRARARRSL